MKTQAVRLDDDMVVLIDAIAKAEKCRPSDVYRMALRDLLEKMAERHESVRTLRQQLAEKRREQHDHDLEQRFGRGV